MIYVVTNGQTPVCGFETRELAEKSVMMTWDSRFMQIQGELWRYTHAQGWGFIMGVPVSTVVIKLTERG